MTGKKWGWRVYSSTCLPLLNSLAPSKRTFIKISLLQIKKLESLQLPQPLLTPFKTSSQCVTEKTMITISGSQSPDRKRLGTGSSPHKSTWALTFLLSDHHHRLKNIPSPSLSSLYHCTVYHQTRTTLPHYYSI